MPLEIPDLSQRENLKILRDWTGGEDSFSRIKWIRVKTPSALEDSVDEEAHEVNGTHNLMDADDE